MLLQVENRRIGLNRFGEGAPLLFVHGWGGTKQSLLELAKLASHKFEVILLDLPGFGESDLPDQSWGIEEYAKFVSTIIHLLKLNNLTYFGHSFGGSLGMLLARQNNPIIKNLILCNTAFRRNKADSFLDKFGLPPSWKKGIQHVGKKLVYPIFFRHADLLKFPQLESNYRKIITQDLPDYLPTISIPTLILWGEQDTYTPVIFVPQIVEKIPNAQVRIFPKYTHNLPIQHPEVIWPTIEQFLDSQL